MDKIPKGYYMKARIIQESDIYHAPPHVREIWDWLLMQANHSDNGHIKRGMTMRTYRDIQDGLSWYQGWRKHAYTKSHCETAMKWLKNKDMITTRKTTRGMIITICNYNTYQDPSAYESHKEIGAKATRQPQPSDTINKNVKKEKNEKNNIYIPVHEVITYLNKATGKHYKDTIPKTISLIKARTLEGHTANDMQTVVDRKVKQWMHDVKMEKFLRPETLFGNKFEGYLQETDKTYSQSQRNMAEAVKEIKNDQR